jgi:hypothetical protein
LPAHEATINASTATIAATQNRALLTEPLLARPAGAGKVGRILPEPGAMHNH